MEGTLINTVGEIKPAHPGNGKKFTLEEAQRYVGGWVELVRLPAGEIMLCNEEGAINGMSVNIVATRLCHMKGIFQTIYGDVIICRKQMF